MTKNGNESPILGVRGGNWDNDRGFYVRVSLEEIQFGSQLRGTDTGFRTRLPVRQPR
jgi:hypothetical protein